MPLFDIHNKATGVTLTNVMLTIPIDITIYGEAVDDIEFRRVAPRIVSDPFTVNRGGVFNVNNIALNGLVGGKAVIWSILSANVTTSAPALSQDFAWHIGGSPMQGQNTNSIFVDPSMNGDNLSLLVNVGRGSLEDSKFSAVVNIVYPVPVLGGTPAQTITGVVGDVIDIDIVPYFYDGNPNNAQNASLTYSISAGSLPSGLTLQDGRIKGTLGRAVTSQAFTIRAANSGGAVTVSSTATITGGSAGTILYNQDFNAGSGLPANMIPTDPDIIGTIDPTYNVVVSGYTNAYYTPGALIINQPINVANFSEVRRTIDISGVATGDNIEIRAAFATERKSATGYSAYMYYEFRNSSDAVIGSTVNIATLAVASSGLKNVFDGVVTVAKPAGAVSVVLRWRATIWTNNAFYFSHASVRTPAAVVVPAIQSAEITGTGKVGDAHTVSYNVTPLGTTVSYQWTRSGVNISGANASTFTTTATEDTTNLGCILTPTGGSPYNAQSVPITRPLPVVTLAPTITPKSANVGDTLTFTAGAASNNATTSVEVLRDGVSVYSGAIGGTITSAVAGTYVVRATYTNSGGAITQSDTTTVTASQAGLPIIMYDQSFSTDRSADFVAGSSTLGYDGALVYPLEGNGAMLIGGVGESYPSRSLEFAAQAGKSYEVFTRTKITGSGSNVGRGYFQFLDVNDTVLYTATDISLGDFQPSLPVAPAGTTKIRIKFEVRGVIATGTTRRLEVHRVQLADISASGPSPVFTFNLPKVVSPYAYVGIETLGIDFAVAFSGTKTSYVYDGPEPHRWVGSVLYITPNAVVAPTQSRYVYALNGSLQAKGGAILRLNVKTTPATIALNSAARLLTDAPEVNRPMVMRRPHTYVTGGVEPYVITLTSKPSWVLASPDNTKFTGIAPATPQALTNVSVRVTDQRGEFVDLDMPVQVVALRSRTPFATIAPTGDLKTAIGASKGAGRVFQLQAGNYAMGNWYGFITATPDNPMIIRGVGNTTIMSGACFADECQGLIFENMACRFTAQPAVESNGILIANGYYNRYYDIDCEGWQVDISALPPTSWVRSETYAHLGSGILGGFANVFDNIALRKLHTGISVAKGNDVSVHNSSITLIRDDIMTVSQCSGLVISNMTGGTFDGNHDGGEHRDLIQFMGDNSPGVRDAWIKNVFLSSKNAGQAGAIGGNQGLFMENDGFETNASKNANFGWTTDRANLRYLIQDCVFLPGSNYGIYLKGHVDTLIKQTVAVNHPDQTTGLVAALQNAGQNAAALTGIVHEGSGFSQAPTVVLHKNLLTLVDSASIDIGVTAIFPNWANTSAVYEDPRDAVKNGQPASSARFWINPNSAWGIANPTKGPAWLRTGAAA